jgi:ABC-2 type transport system ATP-binding protein
MENIIKTDNIIKHYGKVHAVDGVSLFIKKGEIYGFLGLNGAGKTTTILILLGIIRPTSGTAYLFGKRVNARDSGQWNKVGYLVERSQSYPELTVFENLEIIRRLRNVPDIKSVNNIIDRLQLLPYKEMKAKNLSLGNAQRLALAKALLHNPDILILDEPANGLDPAGIVEIREMLLGLAANQEITIFISSHILGEISRLATRIGIIHKGKLLEEVNATELNAMRQKRLLFDVHDKKAAQSKLNENGFLVALTKEGLLEIKDDKAINHPEYIANLLVYAGLPPTMLKVTEEDLESYFLRTVGINGGI